MRAESRFSKAFSPLPTFFNNLSCLTPQKDLSDEFSVWIMLLLCIGKMPRRMECFGQCEMLLCDDSAGYALQLVSSVDEWRRPILTDRSNVFINLSVSTGLIKLWHSMIPIASLGITVKCSWSVWLMILQ